MVSRSPVLPKTRLGMSPGLTGVGFVTAPRESAVTPAATDEVRKVRRRMCILRRLVCSHIRRTADAGLRISPTRPHAKGRRLDRSAYGVALLRGTLTQR